jgi:hypothetical protein
MDVTETETIVKIRHRTQATGLHSLASRYHKKPMYNDVALLTVAEPPAASRGSCCSIARRFS